MKNSEDLWKKFPLQFSEAIDEIYNYSATVTLEENALKANAVITLFWGNTRESVITVQANRELINTNSPVSSMVHLLKYVVSNIVLKAFPLENIPEGFKIIMERNSMGFLIYSMEVILPDDGKNQGVNFLDSSNIDTPLVN